MSRQELLSVINEALEIIDEIIDEDLGSCLGSDQLQFLITDNGSMNRYMHTGYREIGRVDMEVCHWNRIYRYRGSFGTPEVTKHKNTEQDLN
jgi:hypothetical protein